MQLFSFFILSIEKDFIFWQAWQLTSHLQIFKREKNGTMEKGFIILPRTENEYFEQFNERASKYEAWIDLLQQAAYKDKIYINSIVRRGELITSIRKLADAWLWDKDTVRMYLKMLERDGKIEIVSSGYTGTKIKIVDYDRYQGKAKADTTTTIFTRDAAIQTDTDRQKAQKAVETTPAITRAAENEADIDRHPTAHSEARKINENDTSQQAAPRHTNNINNNNNYSVCVEPASEPAVLFSDAEYQKLVSEHGKDCIDDSIERMKSYADRNGTVILHPNALIKSFVKTHNPARNNSRRTSSPYTRTASSCRPKQTNNKFNNFSQRTNYDFEELEKKLCGF